MNQNPSERQKPRAIKIVIVLGYLPFSIILWDIIDILGSPLRPVENFILLAVLLLCLIFPLLYKMNMVQMIFYSIKMLANQRSAVKRFFVYFLFSTITLIFFFIVALGPIDVAFGANQLFDKSKEQVHISVISTKGFTRRNVNYLIVPQFTKPWLGLFGNAIFQLDPSIHVRIYKSGVDSRKLFDAITPGISKVVIASKEGYFGIPYRVYACIIVNGAGHEVSQAIEDRCARKVSGALL